jgi:hypothetical protein
MRANISHVTTAAQLGENGPVHPSQAASRGRSQRRRPAIDSAPLPARTRINALQRRALRALAARVGGAARVGSPALLFALAGCALLDSPERDARGVEIAVAEPPSAAEDYCAWYGDAGSGVLYFGQAAFWSAYRAHGEDPTADLREPGPQLIGRFDLDRGVLLPPLDVGRPGSRSGVWDVLAHANGRVYFTTYFESMGSVDPRTGEVAHFDRLGAGLNELAPGPRASLLASRYGAAGGGGGSVVVIDPDGGLLAEHPITARGGRIAAPKTVAFDPIREEIWATTDLLPAGSGEIGHDAVVLDASGRELRRIERPEIQFVAFARDGTGYFAEAEEGSLFLRIRWPSGRSRRIRLERNFARALDFAQDVHVADGSVVIARWSGLVHVLERGGALRTLRLPKREPGALYYSAVLADDRVCATLCADVSVVCVELRR